MKSRQRTTEGAVDVVKNPARMRILGWLAGQPVPRTKREIGRALSMSNATVHYHVSKLEKAGLMQFTGTRQGPNSITERLFSGKGVTGKEMGAMNDKEKFGFYVRYTMDSIGEMHREAEQMIKSDPRVNRFLIGCYGVHASEPEIKRLGTRLMNLLKQFHEKHKRPGRNTRPMAVTFGLVPSSGLAWGNTQKVFDMLS